MKIKKMDFNKIDVTVIILMIIGMIYTKFSVIINIIALIYMMKYKNIFKSKILQERVVYIGKESLFFFREGLWYSLPLNDDFIINFRNIKILLPNYIFTDLLDKRSIDFINQIRLYSSKDINFILMDKLDMASLLGDAFLFIFFCYHRPNETGLDVVLDGKKNL